MSKGEIEISANYLGLTANKLAEIASDLAAENNELRELIDGLRYCANESHNRCITRFVDGYVTYCPLYDVSSGRAKCEELMLELKVL